MAGDTADNNIIMATEKTTVVKSYSSTMDENGSLGGGSDLTARNHSRHENENREGDPSTTAQHKATSGDDSDNGKDKKPPLHQMMSMEDGTNTKNRGSGQYSLLCGVFCLALGGIVLGLVLPQNSYLPSRSWQISSNIIGYTYFLAWSSSFYPQIFLNYHRRTTRGLSVDFCVLNVLGYVCYTTYTTNFYLNETVIQAYRDRAGGTGGEITVQGNDVAFAIHAILMASVTLSQIGLYDTFVVRPPSRRIYLVLIATGTFCLFYILSTWLYYGQVDFLGFLYVLGTIKVGVTIGKYVPQALLNQSRKSTVGWNVYNVILDLTGGVLSLLQLVGDCADMRDWSGITGNPAKMALALVTICFDLMFLVQHYILYPDADDRPLYSPLPGIESSGAK